MEKNKRKNVYRRYYQSFGLPVGVSTFLICLALIIIPNTNITSDVFSTYYFLMIAAIVAHSFSYAIKERKRIHEILDNGKEYTGVIASYATDKLRAENKKRVLVAVVRYHGLDGLIRQAVVPSFVTSIVCCPIGTSVDIVVDEKNKEGILLGKSKRTLKGKDGLLITDHGEKPKGVVRREFSSCTCPKCGAPLMVANHGTFKCEHCDSLISLDDFTKVDDIYDVSVQAEMPLQKLKAISKSYDQATAAPSCEDK